MRLTQLILAKSVLYGKCRRIDGFFAGDSLYREGCRDSPRKWRARNPEYWKKAVSKLLKIMIDTNAPASVRVRASPTRSNLLALGCLSGVSRSVPFESVTIHRREEALCPHMPDRNDQPEPQRKQATIVFADLSGFTAMSENLDPEQVRESVNRYFEALSAAVYRYQGTIDKYIGDCVMAVFGVPVTHENDCERACCAALDMQQAVREVPPRRSMA